ncbi:hypothetical protein L3X38_017592 [Prunus dulcis]|uniref:Uncharacterized protein n=1 Tax=Prunus dulcis TaxID=3755 RepID=A0AAD4W853_PRUDU|nr:hypothetical protein L3X38_017592 [Prunus dulcis]
MAQSKQKENPAENAKCKLLNWIGTSEVGIREIASTDPSSLVHHVPLGHECWKVWVNDELRLHGLSSTSNCVSVASLRFFSKGQRMLMNIVYC